MTLVIYSCTVGGYSVSAECRWSWGKPYHVVIVSNEFGRIESRSICAESSLRNRFMYYVRKCEKLTGATRSDIRSWWG